MENTQLSLLNALFGGKPPSDALTLGKPLSGALPGDGEAQDNPQGFLSFLQGLLTPAPQAGEEPVNTQGSQKGETAFHGLNIKALKEQRFGEMAPLEDNSFAAAPLADTALADPTLAAPLQQELSAPQAGPVIAQDALAIESPIAATPFHPFAPAIPVPVVAASAAAMEIERTVADAIASPEKPRLAKIAAPDIGIAAPAAALEIAPPLAEGPAALAAPAAPEKPGLAAVVAPQHPAAQASPHGAPLVPVQPTPAVEFVSGDTVVSEDPALFDDSVDSNELSDSELEVRAGLVPERSQIKAPGIIGHHNANALTAMMEHAAPEALAHSAIAREGGVEVAGFDRLASARFDAAAHAAGRTVDFNPVRDQIVAAVTSRPGDSKLEVRLDPPELGKVMIGFERDGAEIVRAIVTAESPNTLDLMRRNADMLQRALEEQGFSHLDLQFADKGAREDAQAETDETPRHFTLAEDEITAAVAAQGLGRNQGLVNGRLDRRL